jgi:hypothetical protein
VGSGNGTTAAEIYTVFNPTNLSSTSIAAGGAMLIRSALTGGYCRLASLPADTDPCTTQGLVCDQASAAGASSLTWSGNSITSGGVPLVQHVSSTMLTLSADPACGVPCGDKLTARPAPGGDDTAVQLFVQKYS